MAPLARGAAECLGTAFLLAAVVGSGIMAARLAGGNGALALLCNTLPTGAILAALILTFAPISGAHFNPAVSIAFALRGEMSWPDAVAYISVQITFLAAGFGERECPLWVTMICFRLHRLTSLLPRRKLRLHRCLRLPTLRGGVSCRLICQTRSSSLVIKNLIDCLQLYSLSKSDVAE
jgi:hypothetical protein